MVIGGYLLGAIGLYFLYVDRLILGCLVFMVGGFLAGRASVSIGSFGVLMLLSSVAYGYHNGYSPLIFFLVIIGVVMACFDKQRPGAFRLDGGIPGASDSADSGGDGGGD